MKRVINFRGFRTDGGGWIYGDLIQTPELKYRIIGYEDTSSDGVHSYNDFNHEVVKESIGQFTGLYDKHGKGIYEGDIMINPNNRCGKKRFSVEWTVGGYDARYFEQGNYTLCLYPVLGEFEGCEVIGNLFNSEVKEPLSIFHNDYKLSYSYRIDVIGGTGTGKSRVSLAIGEKLMNDMSDEENNKLCVYINDGIDTSMNKDDFDFPIEIFNVERDSNIYDNILNLTLKYRNIIIVDDSDRKIDTDYEVFLQSLELMGNNHRVIKTHRIVLDGSYFKLKAHREILMMSSCAIILTKENNDLGGDRYTELSVFKNRYGITSESPNKLKFVEKDSKIVIEGL